MCFSESIVPENLHKISGETKTFCIPVKVLLHSLQCERKKKHEEQNGMIIPAMLMHIQIQISNTLTRKKSSRKRQKTKHKQTIKS